MKFLDDSGLNYLVGKITDLKTAYNYNERSQYSDSFLNYTLEDLKRINTSGTWNGNVYIFNGVTATVNNDMSITFDGTYNERHEFDIVYNGTVLPPVGYYLFGCPSGGGIGKYCLNLTYEDSEEASDVYFDYGQGVQITHVDSSADRIYLSIVIDTTVSNLTFSPRICSNSQGITHSVLDDLYNSSYASNSKKLHTITGGLTVGKLNDNYPLFDVTGGSSNKTIKFFRGTQYNSTKTSKNSPAIVIDNNKIRFRNELLFQRNTYVPEDDTSSILKSLCINFRLSDRGIYLGHKKENKGDSYLKMSHSHTYLIGAEMLTLNTGGSGTIRIGEKSIFSPKPQKIELTTTDSRVEIKPTSMYLRIPKKVQFDSNSAQSTVSGYIDNFRVYAEDVDFYIPIKSDDTSGKFNLSVGDEYRLRIGKDATDIINGKIRIESSDYCNIITPRFDVSSATGRATIWANRQQFILCSMQTGNTYKGYQYMITDLLNNRLMYIQTKQHTINGQTYDLGKFSLACPTITKQNNTFTQGRRRFLWYMSGYNGTQTTTNFDGLRIGYDLDDYNEDYIHFTNTGNIHINSSKAYYTHSTSSPTANDEIATIGDVNANTQSSITVEGNFIHIEDAAPINAEDCKVILTPKQDLHGYDKPWPAGGGKNKANIADMNITTQTTMGRVTLPSGTYVASATVKNNTSIGGAVKINTSSETLALAGIPSASGTSRVSTASFTLSESTEISIVVSGALSGYSYDVSQVQIELGSTATSYEPYANICPISGWTGVQGKHSGADTTQYTEIPVTFPTEAGTVYGGKVDVVNGKLTVTKAMVDLGRLTWNYLDTGSAVAPYFWTSTADLPDGNVKFNGAPWDVVYTAYCTTYKVVKRGQYSFIDFTLTFDGDATTISKIEIKDSNYTDAQTFKNAMNGVKLVYELATPIEYDLTPQQVQLLLGINNIWADNGTLNLTYQPNNVIGELKGEIQNLQEQINTLITQLNNLS